MDEKPQKPSVAWVVVIVLLLASVPLYVLSIGPAVYLYDRGAISFDLLRTVYAPFGWLESNSPTFARALKWYVLLWTGPPPPRAPSTTPNPAPAPW